MNLFAYCNNNPVNYLDPGGTDPLAVQYWTASMWWLCLVDAVLPIGDIIYGAGILILSVFAVTVLEETVAENDNIMFNVEDPSPTTADDEIPASEDLNRDKDARLKGNPGEVNKEGYKETKIGPDGKATKERHWTDHRKPHKHTNPHDHDISWDQNDNPVFGPPQNYWDGNIPIFP